MPRMSVTKHMPVSCSVFVYSQAPSGRRHTRILPEPGEMIRTSSLCVLMLAGHLRHHVNIELCHAVSEDDHRGRWDSYSGQLP